MIGPHVVEAQELEGEHTIPLASSNGFKSLQGVCKVYKDCATSLFFRVTCKDKVVLVTPSLGHALEAYNKVDAT